MAIETNKNDKSKINLYSLNRFFKNSIMDEPLLTKQDVADDLKISVKTIDKMVCSKQIPFYKIGRLVRFQREEIKEWLLKQRSQHGDNSSQDL